MDTTEIYKQAKEILQNLKGWNVLDSLLVLETAKQQLLADTMAATQADREKKKKAGK